MVNSKPNPVQHIPIQNHEINSLLCTVDMFDITPRHGSRLRLKPESGLPFWVKASDLPKKVRNHALNMEAGLLLISKKQPKLGNLPFDGICNTTFLKLLASPSTRLIAA